MTSAIVFLPGGTDLKQQMRKTLLHSCERTYDIIALALGERGWPGARQMLDAGEVDVIVTSGHNAHSSESGVEVAGSGRLTLRTPARARRLRQIADLVDSGLSDEMILRILRSAR